MAAFFKETEKLFSDFAGIHIPNILHLQLPIPKRAALGFWEAIGGTKSLVPPLADFRSEMQMHNCRWSNCDIGSQRPRAALRQILEPFERVGAAVLSDLLQCLCLDLPDAFAGDAELLPHLLQRMGYPVIQPEAHL